MRQRAKNILRPKATQERAKAAPTGKAGRNLPAAIGVGAALIGALLLSLLHPFPLAVLIILAGALGLYELAGAFARSDSEVMLPPLWVGMVGMVVCAYFIGPEGMMGAYFATLLALVLWRSVESLDQSAMRDILVSVFAATYVPFLGSFLVLMGSSPQGTWPVALAVLLPVCSDTGGYAAGVKWGKTPMAPKISPKKSWEGFAGSVVAAVVAGTVGMWLLGASPLWGILLGVAAATFGSLGDLGESLLKRDLGLKDMGWLLPGHGGVMDRLDSILLATPVCYFIFRVAFGW